MSSQPVIVAWDDNAATARMMAQSFSRAGFAFRMAPSLRAVLSASTDSPSLVLLHAEARSEEVRALLGALAAEEGKFAGTPVVLLCQDVSERDVIAQFRTGLVELLSLPFQSTYPARITELLRTLPTRAGMIRGTGVARALGDLQSFLRSGKLEVNAGAAGMGTATFAAGKVVAAEYGGQKGPEALTAMVKLANANWKFTEPSEELIQLEDDDIPDVEILPDDDFEAAQVTQSVGPTTVTAEIPVGEPSVQLLFVDDDPELCRMFSILFGRYGFDLTIATDGEAGFEAAVARPYDILIADLNMPKLDGWGLLRRIRDDYRTREVVFALLSNQDNYRESLEALDAGAQAYFSKTTTPLKLLVQKVRGLLEPRRQFEEALKAERVSHIPLSVLGPQWVLKQMEAAKLTGRLDVQDPWAAYQVFIRNGDISLVTAKTGTQQLDGERALLGFVASRATEAKWSPRVTSAKQTFILPTSFLLERAAFALNENASRVKDALLVQPGEIEINSELYRIYVQNGPEKSLPTAKLLCEERLTPKQILLKLNESPLELEETLKDLMRRGVVTFKPPPRPA